jgi:hypothetical protein
VFFIGVKQQADLAEGRQMAKKAKKKAKKM